MDVPARYRTAVILLNYKGYRDTAECLESLKQALPPHVHVIVVENGSGDDSASRLQKEFPWVTVIDTGANLGFAGGNNAGIRLALEEGAEYICLLNNDTLVEQGFLEPLEAVFRNHADAGMATGLILYAKPPQNIWSAGGKLNPFTALTRHEHLNEPRENAPKAEFKTSYAVGCLVMLSRSSLEQAGLMDESYFLYYEDTDWSIKVRKAGLSIYYAPGPAVFHKVSASTGGMSPLTRYYFDRNSVYFIRRNFPLAVRIGFIPCFMARMGYRFLKAALSRDRQGWTMACHTLRDIFARRMGPYRAEWRKP